MRIFLILAVVIASTQSLPTQGDYTEQNYVYYLNLYEGLISDFKLNFKRMEDLSNYFWKQNYDLQEFPYSAPVIENLKSELATKYVPIGDKKYPPECKILDYNDLYMSYNETFFNLGKKLDRTYANYTAEVLEPVNKSLKDNYENLLEPLKEQFEESTDGKSRKDLATYLMFFINELRKELSDINSEMENSKQQLEVIVRLYLMEKKYIDGSLKECEKFIKLIETANVIER